MHKIWLIIQREYITRVKKRSFILTTLLAPAGFALLMIAMIFIVAQGEADKRIVVKDDSGYFRGHAFKDSIVYFHHLDSSITYLKENYKKLNYDGIIWITAIPNINHPPKISYLSDRQLSVKSQTYIEEQLEEVLKEKKLEQENIDRKTLEELENIKVNVQTSLLDEFEGERKADSALASGFGYMMGFVIYMVLFIYGAMVMKGVAEEKTSRIMEVLASSVRPFQLMMGKIIGIGAVGLTQFILWFILSIIAFFVISIIFGEQIMELQNLAANPDLAKTASQEEAADMMAALSELPILMYLFFFLFYFLGGYLIYGALYAALGSAVNDEGDAQSLTVVVSIPIILSIGIMMSAIQEPNSSLAVWGSIIPFTAPIVMPARIPFILGTEDSWQIWISMLSVVIGFIFTTWISAKIYRTGILMYGKKVTVKEIFKWVVRSDAF